MEAYRRVGVSAWRRGGAQQKIHTQVTEVRKGQEGLKGFRIYEELDFARFGLPAYILCAIIRPSRPSCASVIATRRYADTPIRRERRKRRKRRYAATPPRSEEACSNAHAKAKFWPVCLLVTRDDLKPIAPLIILTALLIGLPILGATSAGHPISLYLEFPPHTRYVQHAPFSWSAFALVGTGALLAGAVFIFLYLPRRPETHPVTVPHRFPWWGWVSGFLILCFWTLAWKRFSWFSPLQSFTFTP